MTALGRIQRTTERERGKEGEEGREFNSWLWKQDLGTYHFPIYEQKGHLGGVFFSSPTTTEAATTAAATNNHHHHHHQRQQQPQLGPLLDRSAIAAGKKERGSGGQCGLLLGSCVLWEMQSDRTERWERSFPPLLDFALFNFVIVSLFRLLPRRLYPGEERGEIVRIYLSPPGKHFFFARRAVVTRVRKERNPGKRRRRTNMGKVRLRTSARDFPPVMK